MPQLGKLAWKSGYEPNKTGINDPLADTLIAAIIRRKKVIFYPASKIAFACGVQLLKI